MTTLDQRILIPASPITVWDYISTIDNNPHWQANCQRVTFLTGFKKGSGVRWRYEDNNRHEYVVEIISWYDGLGYEYTIVDGLNYENRGRIRLQEIAEGTIVQWTFNYELRGVLAGLRDSVSVRRSHDQYIVESLRTLWKQIGNQGDQHIARTLMRDAPTVEERAQYIPRHQSKANNHVEPALDTPLEPDTDSEHPGLIEPPLSDEDTRPTQTMQAVPEQPEPDFLEGVENFDHTEVPQTDSLAESPTQQIGPTSDEDRFRPPQKSEPPVETTASDESGTLGAGWPVPEPEEQRKTLDQLEDPSDLDTSQLSVFEIFGLQKPSETQQMRAVEAQQSQDSGEYSQSTEFEEIPDEEDKLDRFQPMQAVDVGDEEVVQSAEPQAASIHEDRPGLETLQPGSTREGLRRNLRRHLVHLRRP